MSIKYLSRNIFVMSQFWYQ